jgi:ElaB/YqjD/DUF883 family membrane-anchored ribosome-binding protein
MKNLKKLATNHVMEVHDMKKAIIPLLVLSVLMVCPVGAIVCGPPPTAPGNPVNSNSMMGPAAYNACNAAAELKEKAHSLLDQAMEQDLDVTEIEELIEKADSLLEEAQQIMRANPIPATNMAREAGQFYEQAISDLEALLG